MSARVSSRAAAVMGTIVSVQAISAQDGHEEAARRDQALARALAWFDDIERRCTRFAPDSEVMRLASRPGEPVPVSPMVFELIRFAMAVAEDTGGAFDPAVGSRMERMGFNREHRAGATVRFGADEDAGASFRDIACDETAQTVTLKQPLVLDLGAVAKGLATDLAARELAGFAGFAIDAGGDLYLGGTNQDGLPWSAGIRHPRRHDELIGTLTLTGRAVCTSGDYERPAPGAAGAHHIIDPRTGASPHGVASVTVVAPSALLADALGTAAFVLGPDEGLRLLERHAADGVEGLIVTPSLERFPTRGMERELICQASVLAG